MLCSQRWNTCSPYSTLLLWDHAPSFLPKTTLLWVSLIRGYHPLVPSLYWPLGHYLSLLEDFSNQFTFTVVSQSNDHWYDFNNQIFFLGPCLSGPSSPFSMALSSLQFLLLTSAVKPLTFSLLIITTPHEILISDKLLSYHHLLSFELLLSGPPNQPTLLNQQNFDPMLLLPSHCSTHPGPLSPPHPVKIP